MVQDIHKICTIIDKLTLDSLTLIQQEIQSKLDLEKAMSDGDTNLAKARYIMGHKNVSKLQLPTEDSNEFDALAVVHPNEHKDIMPENLHDLEMHKISNKSEEKLQDPLHWFGILVPQNLRYAQQKFKQAILYAVNASNTQIQLQETLNILENLKVLKAEIRTEE